MPDLPGPPGPSLTKAPKLTSRQQQILELVRSAIENTGSPPTRAEIATELGFRSANAAEEHLKALARKGVIELIGGTSRGIRLKSDTLRELNASRLSQLGESYLPPSYQVAHLSLPLIGRVAAGSPMLALEHVEQTYLLDASMFTSKPDYLLRVKGMSMRDAGILDGDLLAVKQAKDAKDGEIVVARIGDEVTVKRLKRGRHGIALMPENPDFAPIIVGPESEEFSLEGIAVGLVRHSFGR